MYTSLRIVISTVALLLIPLAVQAMNADRLAEACKAGDKACQSYSFGVADRYWLVQAKPQACDTESDKKTHEALKKAVEGKGTLYATTEQQPAAAPLLKYLADSKSQSCALSISFADLTAQCTSQQAEDQKNCNAYIAGVIDAAILMDQIHQVNVEKAATLKPSFCENGAPKKNMSNGEVLGAIAEYGTSPEAAKAANNPAAQVVMDALLKKYSCSKPAAPAKTTATKKDKK